MKKKIFSLVVGVILVIISTMMIKFFIIDGGINILIPAFFLILFIIMFLVGLYLICNSLLKLLQPMDKFITYIIYFYAPIVLVIFLFLIIIF